MTTDKPYIARVADRDSRVYELALWWVWLTGAGSVGAYAWAASGRLLVAGVAAVLGFAASFAAAAYVVNAEYKAWGETQCD